MKYAHYNKQDGKLLGWYSKDIHNKIPTPNLEVSEKKWKESIKNNYNYVDVKNNTLSKKDFRTEEEVLESKKRKLENSVLRKLDETCQKYGFTGDNKTRPYRSIANYVGYPNKYREIAERLGAWIAEVFFESEKITSKEIADLGIEQLLKKIPDFKE